MRAPGTTVDIELVPSMLRRYARFVKTELGATERAELPAGIGVDDVVSAAVKLVETAHALDRLLWVINQDRDGDYFICREGEAEIQIGNRLVAELGLRAAAASTDHVGYSESQREKELIATIQHSGLVSEDLDGLVHDAASALGASANNEGMEGQVRFLVQQWGYDAVVREVARLGERPSMAGG